MPEDTDSRGTAPEQIVDYDAFLSHASADKHPGMSNSLRGCATKVRGCDAMPGNSSLAITCSCA